MGADPARGRRRWPPLRLVLRAAAVSVIGLLIALLTMRVLAEGAGSHLVSEVEAGERPRAPEFDLPVLWERAETWPGDLRGALADGRLSPRELRGYAVVMNFWASWCVPCKAEAPLLVASAKAHAGEVVFLGVDVQDFASDARRFLERYGTNYVSVRDGGDSTFEAYGLTGLPETFYLDQEGGIVAHSLGEISEEELAGGIDAALRGRPLR
jgi:cytochrome c biogenesis protein CcmG/thiol:disulfide interchange protein DsbE